MSGDEEERQSIQQTSQMFAAQITQLLFKVPRVLLLLLKTNDCLRSVDLALGQVTTFICHVALRILSPPYICAALGEAALLSALYMKATQDWQQ